MTKPGFHGRKYREDGDRNSGSDSDSELAYTVQVSAPKTVRVEPDKWSLSTWTVDFVKVMSEEFPHLTVRLY